MELIKSFFIKPDYSIQSKHTFSLLIIDDHKTTITVSHNTYNWQAPVITTYIYGIKQA